MGRHGQGRRDHMGRRDDYHLTRKNTPTDGIYSGGTLQRTPTARPVLVGVCRDYGGGVKARTFNRMPRSLLFSNGRDR